MINEEREKAIDALKISAPIMAVTQSEFDDYIHTVNKIMDWLEQEPYEDAISRQAVNTLIDELARAISDERCCISRGRSTATIMQDILDLPSVKPQEPKVGHWIKGAGMWICDQCGYEKTFGIATKFCSHCGAKMD